MTFAEDEHFRGKWGLVLDDLIDEPPEDCVSTILLKGEMPADLENMTTLMALVPSNEEPDGRLLIFPTRSELQSIGELFEIGNCEDHFEVNSGTNGRTKSDSEKLARSRVLPYAILIIGNQEGPKGENGRYAILYHLDGFDPKETFQKINRKCINIAGGLLN